VGLYKICEHTGRSRDRCEHAWWGSFRGVRVSLAKWTNRQIDNKALAFEALDELRLAVRNGTFNSRGLEPPRDVTTLTFREFADIYKQRHVFAKGLAIGKTIDYRLRPLVDRFDDRALADLKTADIEDFIADLKLPRTILGQANRTLSPASINRTIELLRHMMNWAVGREYLERTPFRRGTETLIRKQHEDNQRRRRISEDEETSLLAVAPPFLRSMIIAALDTGMRQGEMLALRFADIDEQRQLIVLRGVTTKSKKTRVVPLSTTRLKAVLDWLWLDAAGEKKPGDALVFSDEAGEPIGRFRTAWVTAVLKAHDVKPVWKSYNWTALTPACQREFRRINLHWHDLRHEYASRLVERGVPLAQVRDLLGHASITTTERYDNQKLENLQAAVLKLESGKTFDPTVGNDTKDRIDDRDKVSSFFQVQAKVPRIDDQEIDQEIEPNSEDANDLGNWLGGRDSNPDNVVQRAVTALRSVRVCSGLFGFSSLSLQCVPVCSGVFTHKMSQCVSGGARRSQASLQ
jgi:integrase